MHVLYGHQVHVGGEDEKQCSSSSASFWEFGVGRSENVAHQVTEILVWNALHSEGAVQWHVADVTTAQSLLTGEDSFLDVVLLEIVLQPGEFDIIMERGTPWGESPLGYLSRGAHRL